MHADQRRKMAFPNTKFNTPNGGLIPVPRIIPFAPSNPCFIGVPSVAN